MAEQFGHYAPLERLGVGGLGTVFRARDTVVGRTVLVKNVSEQVLGDKLARARFLTDARAAATVSHPNIATLFEVGDSPGQLYLVFEFVPGTTLDEVVQGEGPFDVRRAIQLGIQLAEALTAAHSLGVLHLDLRPANVKVSRRGHAKLLDVGLSAWTTGGRAARAGFTGRAQSDEGARPYRAPEQHRGDPVDHQSDLYSLGVVMFEMLTGRLPDAAASAASGPPPGPRAVNPAVPTELDDIVRRALAERPEDRFQGAVSMAAELRSLAAIIDVRSGDRDPPSFVAPTEDSPDAPAEPAEAEVWNVPALVAAALVVVALVGVLGWWLG